jgi:prepilin-type processing-associated H-X9-DG protein
MYASEKKGNWPKPMGNFLHEGNPSVSWQIALQVYMQMNFPKVNQDTIFLCPEAQRTYPGGQARRTYALNSAGTNAKVSRSMLMINRPSQTALVLDSGPTGGGVGDGWHTFGINSYEKVAEFRHNQGLNILFVDGSVRQLSGANTEQLEEYVQNFIY